jgi:hypothetical protein
VVEISGVAPAIQALAENFKFFLPSLHESDKFIGKSAYRNQSGLGMTPRLP